MPVGGYHVDKVMLIATAGATVLPTMQERAQICQQGKKDISCFIQMPFVPLGFVSFVNQPRGRKNPEGLLLDPSLDRQSTRGTTAGKRQQAGVLAAGNISGAAPSAAPQHHYRVGNKETANLE